MSKMVPDLWDNLHIGEHDHSKPENSSDTEANISHVYENILIHIMPSSDYSTSCPYSVEVGKNPLVYEVFDVIIIG